MAEQDKRKKRIRGLLWAGFVLLLIVIGLGPLVLVISYTRDINLMELFQRGPRHEVEATPELPEPEPYVVQYLYRYCGHHALYEPDSIPPELDLPPAGLVGMAAALHESNTSIQDIMSHLKDTDGWYVANMRVNSDGSYFTFTCLDDLCPDCKGHYYLGILKNGADDYIALFEGRPPGGKLYRVTPHPVRDDTREELERGVVLESLDELYEMLQGYTS